MDYIVALGNGMVVLKDNVLDLTPESKITALSAGILYKEGKAKKIIFSGGHTKGRNKESEAKKMFELMKNRFPEIPDADIILEENSLDTAGNAFEVKKLLPINSKIILLSFAYHLKRAKRIFYNFNLKFEQTVASDSVLEKMSPIYDEFLKKYTLKRRILKLLWEIFCLSFIFIIDPKGKILRIITSRTRGS
jgi:uncharacterized SAM-binding protein YcdF (DUF218 family)